MLLLIAFLTCFTFGYWQRRRFWLVAVVIPLMIAIVMGLIAALFAWICAASNGATQASAVCRQSAPRPTLTLHPLRASPTCSFLFSTLGLSRLLSLDKPCSVGDESSVIFFP